MELYILLCSSKNQLLEIQRKRIMKNILFTLVTLVLFSGCNHKPKIEDNPGAKSADESTSVSTLNNQKRTHNAFRIIRQLIIIFVFLRQI